MRCTPQNEPRSDECFPKFAVAGGKVADSRASMPSSSCIARGSQHAVAMARASRARCKRSHARLRQLQQNVGLQVEVEVVPRKWRVDEAWGPPCRGRSFALRATFDLLQSMGTMVPVRQATMRSATWSCLPNDPIVASIECQLLCVSELLRGTHGCCVSHVFQRYCVLSISVCHFVNRHMRFLRT